ncbi:efflux RND transporter periplasmic adaptor subunit [Mucilaginibacter sp. HC2]|uniref:efflux RND transporter periplasmic adaptor subunit n=1 Tax=Mucilaginibacter inviolabilis TaxID=2714892 RepID=UPI00140A77D7|nr:efflux RND transporter periplasmic adaptor subunit [Mucilaginibacter inviolabilis]NHA03711.1 efflux RND transporter periplasmic adaptor subunit [Mucilaginibacter inviolabilis]
MNNIKKRFWILSAAGLLFFMTVIAVLFTACTQKPKATVTKTANKAYYTCSMHPQIHEDHPGNCPICGMKLIKVEMTGNNMDMTANKIRLTVTQIQLAGIQTDTVREENTGSEKTLTGTVTTDDNRSEELSARLAGRIQQLFIRTTGERIMTGQPVYSIYSEDLQEAEKEYLLAKQQQKVLHNPDVDYQQLISAAENKLQLWGLSPAQIRNIAASGKVSATTTILSKISGTVSEIAVHEGDYVTEGMSILKTQALDNLWIEAQLYASEINSYKENDRVSVSFPDLGGQVTNGKIEFINPELSNASKVNLIRINIPNPQGLIRPGMLAYISIGHGNNHALAVPVSAILTDGKGSLVWVKNLDGSFSSKIIKPGNGNQSYVPVLSGLNAGDIVVTNGAYLLNSEAIFKNGGDNMAGMNM